MCGEKECPYDNFCIADLAGYSQDQCAPHSDCPVPDGDCTADINPVACGADFCVYDNQSCADLVFDSDECLPYLVVNDEPYVGYYDRACRANGSKGDFDVEETDLNTCREKCTEDEKCKGYEYSEESGKCEYHWVSGLPFVDEEEGAFSDSTEDGVQCFWKVSSANDITSFGASPTSGGVSISQKQPASIIGLVILLQVFFKAA